MNFSNDLFPLKESGVRGGSENFTWESLKSMPRGEREHYLGQSLQSDAFMGKNRSNRYSNRKHIFEPTLIRKGKSPDLKIERERYIARERKIMNRLLGIQVEESEPDELGSLEAKKVINSNHLVSNEGFHNHCKHAKTNKEFHGTVKENGTVKHKHVNRNRSFSRSISPV